jgi:hypothetical protein
MSGPDGPDAPLAMVPRGRPRPVPEPFAGHTTSQARHVDRAGGAMGVRELPVGILLVFQAAWSVDLVRMGYSSFDHPSTTGQVRERSAMWPAAWIRRFPSERHPWAGGQRQDSATSRSIAAYGNVCMNHPRSRADTPGPAMACVIARASPARETRHERVCSHKPHRTYKPESVVLPRKPASLAAKRRCPAKFWPSRGPSEARGSSGAPVWRLIWAV